MLAATTFDMCYLKVEMIKAQSKLEDKPYIWIKKCLLVCQKGVRLNPLPMPQNATFIHASHWKNNTFASKFDSTRYN